MDVNPQTITQIIAEYLKELQKHIKINKAILRLCRTMVHMPKGVMIIGAMLIWLFSRRILKAGM